MIYCRSLIKKRQAINRRKGILGSQERDRRLQEAMRDVPVLPVTLTDDIEITVTRRVSGNALPPQRYLLVHEEGIGQKNQYMTWDADREEFLGLMGIDKAFTLAGQRCPRVQRR